MRQYIYNYIYNIQSFASLATTVKIKAAIFLPNLPHKFAFFFLQTCTISSNIHSHPANPNCQLLSRL